MTTALNRSLAVLSGIALLSSVTPALAEKISAEQAKAAIAPFYAALTVGTDKNARQLIEKVTTEQWVSCNSNESCAPRENVIKSIEGLGKIIPDLSWEMKEVLVDGNKVIVRGEATGTPAADFMGVPHAGKSFKVMSIDIHELKDGKMHRSHHIEDWMGVTRQLSAK
ncbi:MAG: ester cyclase [Burkholderiaceae bacterium]